MTATIVDAIPAILAALRADTGVDAATGGRVYGETLPAAVVMDATETNRPAPALVVASAGGIADDYLPIWFPRYELRAYHTRPSYARALWMQAAAILVHGSLRSGGVFVTLNLNAGPNQYQEPDTEWPYVSGFLACAAIGGLS